MSRVPGLCFAIPAAVLVACYLWLAVDHGTLWLWPVVVHESGRYTFGQTVLYWPHFLREVPVVVAYVLFLMGVSGAVPGDVGRGRRVGGRAAVIGLGGGILLVAGAFVATATSAGWGTAFLDLLQYRTRDDLFGYGTHWRYHGLSTAWFGAATLVAPAVTERLVGRPVLRLQRGWMLASWGYVLALTLVFGLSADVFTDVRYAGHQAREILTHGPITLLLGLGLVLAMAGGVDGGRISAGIGGRGDPLAAGGVDGSPAHLPSMGWSWPFAIALVAAILIPLHLAVVSLSGDVMEQGQSELGLSAMIAAHYFEHTLDYLLTALLLIGGLARARA